MDFSITSGEIEPSIITAELNITPERSFIKGDTVISKYSGSVITRPHNLWAIQSKKLSLEEETISEHIEYFKQILLPKIEVLKKYKQDNRFDVSFYVWIETNNAGIGFDLNADEINFLASISNNIHFSIVTNNDDLSD